MFLGVVVLFFYLGRLDSIREGFHINCSLFFYFVNGRGPEQKKPASSISSPPDRMMKLKPSMPSIRKVSGCARLWIDIPEDHDTRYCIVLLTELPFAHTTTFGHVISKLWTDGTRCLDANVSTDLSLVSQWLNQSWDLSPTSSGASSIPQLTSRVTTDYLPQTLISVLISTHWCFYLPCLQLLCVPVSETGGRRSTSASGTMK